MVQFSIFKVLKEFVLYTPKESPMKKSTKAILCGVFGIAFFSISQVTIAQEVNTITSYTYSEDNTLHEVVLPLRATKQLNRSKMLKMDPEAESSKAHFAGLESYIHEHLSYPQLAKENGVEGKVRISFTILQNGQVINPRVVESLGTGCDKAALELVESMPAWVPATKYGLPIGEKKYLDITFSLR